MCRQPHVTHWCHHPGQWWLLCNGKYILFHSKIAKILTTVTFSHGSSCLLSWHFFQTKIFPFTHVYHLCVTGWSDSWGTDGGHSEIHGQGLPTRLVWTLRSQRQTSGGQKVELQVCFLGHTFLQFSISPVCVMYFFNMKCKIPFLTMSLVSCKSLYRSFISISNQDFVFNN